MAIITAHKFNGDATVREFQVGDSILSKSHCRVWVDDLEPDSSTWDLLGSTILFDTAPPVGAVENVRIYVSNDGTFPNEYTSPSATETVEAYIQNVIDVAGGIQNVADVAAIASLVTLVAGMNTEMLSLYADKITLDSLYADKTKLDSIFADKASLDSIFTNLATILSAADAPALTSADRAAIEAIYDTFDDRYLGTKASDPTLDNDGNALQIGAMYFNSTDNETKFYNGSLWESPELTSTQAAAEALASSIAAASSASASEASRIAAELAETNIGTAIASEIGVTIQGYDATIVVDADIGVTVEPYEDKSIIAEDNLLDFTKKNFELTATAANITATGLTGTFPREGTILIHSAENITGWGTEFKFKTVPTDLTGDEALGYFLEDATNIWIGRVQ